MLEPGVILASVAQETKEKKLRQKMSLEQNDHLTCLQCSLVPGISVGNSSAVLLPQDL